MSLEEEVHKIIRDLPMLIIHMEHYAETGHRTYEPMIEFDLKTVYRYYDRDAHKALNEKYQELKKLNKNELR